MKISYDIRDKEMAVIISIENIDEHDIPAIKASMLDSFERALYGQTKKKETDIWYDEDVYRIAFNSCAEAAELIDSLQAYIDGREFVQKSLAFVDTGFNTRWQWSTVGWRRIDRVEFKYSDGFWHVKLPKTEPEILHNIREENKGLDEE